MRTAAIIVLGIICVSLALALVEQRQHCGGKPLPARGIERALT